MTKSSDVFILLAALAPLFLSSCSEGVHASSWKAKGVDYKKYKTYAWLAPGDSALNTRRDDKLFAGTILSASNVELAKKGMKLITDQPDAVFIFDTHLENQVKYSQSPTVSVGVGFAGPGYYVGGMAPVAGGQITAEPYQQGLLVVEMYDLKSQQLIWRGWATSPIDYSSDVPGIIKKACHNIFFYLPIKIKS